jgi:hypothetical protein
MMATMDDEILDDLFEEVEAAWTGRRDGSIVDRLAADHPRFSAELYEFFADLVLGEGEEGILDVPKGVQRWSVQEWLTREGHQIGREAAAAARGGTTPPDAPPALPLLPAAGGSGSAPAQSFFTLLEDRTDLEGEDIAEQLGPNVTVELLLATGQQPELFPKTVREELARRAEQVFGTSAALSLASFDYVPVLHLRAASRGKSFGAAPTSFRELLRRCGLSPEQQMYWISIAKED